MVKLGESPPGILVGVFPKESQLVAATKELESCGISQDFLGILVKGKEDPSPSGLNHAGAILSIRVFGSRQNEIRSILRKYGAVAVGGPSEIAPVYGPVPHPGALEHHDMKLPLGREYPDTVEPPVLSGERVPVRELEPEERLKHFGELDLGYTQKEMWAEASRCLQCPEPSCVNGCPVRNNIPGFIKALLEGDIEKAASVLRQTTSFPGICGRVCDYARQCEGSCILGKEGGHPIAIHTLERFVADRELESGLRWKQAAFKAPASRRRVAVVGSGPTGMAAAGELALRGHEVTIYEAMPVPGGALAWGIPSFRLPPHIIQTEIDFLNSLGAKFEPGTKVGQDITVERLLGNNDAIFLAVGTTVPATPKVPGEDLEGVYTATEFLTRAKLALTAPGHKYTMPKVGEKLALAVIGAGNTAMDVAQTALRLGVKEVTAVDLLPEDQVPARSDELEDAREEGVRFRFLSMPQRFIGDEKGHIKTLECVEIDWSPPDAIGRRRPIPRPGTEFTIEADTVVIAIGFRPDSVAALKGTEGVRTNEAGYIPVDAATGKTSRPRVWAGGDIVTGPGTVVRAMGAGKRAARDIDSYLRKTPLVSGKARETKR